MQSSNNTPPQQFILLQRISVLEKLTAKLMMENDKLTDKVATLENRTVSSDASALHDIRSSVEATLNEVMMSYDTTKLESQAQAAAAAASSDALTSPEGLNGPNKDKTDESEMISLMTGDLICLRHDDSHNSGYVLGDLSLSTLGIKPDQGQKTNPRFNDGIFRVCSALNFRARTERRKLHKNVKRASFMVDSAAAVQEIDASGAHFREQLEEQQNAEYLEALSQGEGVDPIKFGDVIQLQHLASKKFLATHKTPAPMNPNCRRVSLKAGSQACHFRVLPRFKVRSIGSLVYAGDHIQLQSVKFPHLRLGVSANEHGEVNLQVIPQTEKGQAGKDNVYSSSSLSSHYMQQSFMSSTPNSPDSVMMKGLPRFLRPPACLSHRATCEVNASMELYRSFSVKLFFRQSSYKNVLYSGAYFRLFHPEANAFVQASANADKGEILDASGELRDPLKIKREDGTSAHIPYLKNFVSSSADASNPIFLSAKAVWSFEPVDNTRRLEIGFNIPLRLKHVASGKFLSVDSTKSIGMTEKQSSMKEQGGEGRGALYSGGLVFDSSPIVEDGKLGSASSVLFYLMPVDNAAETLTNSAVAVRLEHRTSSGQTLYFYAPHTLKSNLVHTERPSSPWTSNKERGFEMCFSSEFSSLDVLRVQPLSDKDSLQLSYFISKVPLFKLYSYRWHCAALGGDPVPADLCEAVVGQCLDLLQVIRKSPPAAPYGGNVTENMKDAQIKGPLAFAATHAGAANPILQKMCLELKLFDSIFDATVAPYNYSTIQGRDIFKQGTNHSENFKSVQMFLYVVIQCIVRDNPLVQQYVTEKYSRVWRLSTPAISLSPSLTSQGDDTNKQSDDILKEAIIEVTGSGNQKTLLKRYELLKDLIIEHGTDTLGATVTLAQLLNSSESIIQRLVNNELMLRFKKLVADVGPELRFINLFSAICYIEGRPSRPSQEMCIRLLWMNETDRYSFGVSFHQATRKDLEDSKMIVGRQRPITMHQAEAPRDYLGRTDSNVFEPICVFWTGEDAWAPNCRSLWWSPKAMNLPNVKTCMSHPFALLDSPNASLVPLEHIMWVLEPYRLCKIITRKHWIPFTQHRSNKALSKGRSTVTSLDTESTVEYVQHNRILTLATYINAELDLLTRMCKGRSYNCIWWLEKSFSYTMLLNMASNPLLPYSTNAVSVELINAMYVDRFPQQSKSFGSGMPHKLWVFHDTSAFESDIPKSSIPVLKAQIDLHCKDAFPAFSLPKLSSAYAHPDPVLSHPDHHKFFLLQSMYSDMILNYGFAGRVIHGDPDFNKLGLAAIQGQQCLLLHGFLSTYVKLKGLCQPSALLFDGRSDLKTSGTNFEPPDARYNDGGPATELVLKIKRELIKTFSEVTHLCTNHRLSRLLHLYKEKAVRWTIEECHHEQDDPVDRLGFDPDNQSSRGKKKKLSFGERRYIHSVDCPEAKYIMQVEDADVEAMYEDFEALFPGGSSEASELDLKVLCDKPDFEVSLVDAIMYEDDELMAASLNLLDTIYGQRRALRTALKEVVLLDRPEVPVFGDVHVLRIEIKELMQLVKTSSTWGVSSAVAGTFGDMEFGQIMSILDRLHLFLFDDGRDNMAKIVQLKNMTENRDTSSTKLWSVDVAKKWSDYTKIKVSNSGHSSASSIHQDLLSTINLHEVLIEAILIDPLVARKDASGSKQDMDESLRRLTMVMRAALSLASAFCYDNQNNQRLLFPHLTYLEKLAIPLSLSMIRKSVSMSEGNLSSMSIHDREWSADLAQSAQVLILSILHKNSALCDEVDDSLPSLFSSIADMSDDLSTAPTLDIIFILVKPGRAPNAEVQLQTCKYFLGFSKSSGLVDSLALCMRTAASDEPFKVDSESMNETSSLPPVVPMLSKSPHTSTASATSYKMEDPARLLRLMTALMEGGNERAANLLNQRANLTIDLTCSTLVSHVECKLKKLISVQNLNTIGEQDEEDDEDDEGGENTVNPNISKLSSRLQNNVLKDAELATLNIITEEDSVGAALFGLLVEQVFLLPLNREQLYSQPFWSFLEKVAVPAFQGVFRVRFMEETISETCGELVCMLEFILTTLVRLTMFERVLEDPVKDRIMNDLMDCADELLKRRQATPMWLEEDFRAASIDYGIEALNRAQFISLMERACHEFQEVEKSVGLTNEICAAYDVAHVCGESGLIDLYEFIRLYRQLSDVLTSKEMSKSFVEINDSAPGFLLSLRTIECAERVVQIQKGNGAALGTKKFARTDRYGSRVRQKHSAIQASLFAASHAGAHEKREKIKHQIRRYSMESNMSDQEEDSVFSMQQKFEMFQKSLDINPLISQALQRRRFSMVSVLEKGTPGPPNGRALQNFNMKPKQTHNTVTGAAQSIKKVWRRAGSIRVAPIYSNDGTTTVSRVRNTSSSTDGGLGKFNVSIFPRSRIKSQFTEKDAAAITIQTSVRILLAKKAYERMKVIAKPGSGKSANRMSGAVELGWSDVAGRFVRYLSEHFWESGDAAVLNVLIIETLLAHLIKARTYFYDIFDTRLSEIDIHKAYRLEFHKPQDLTKSEFNHYNTKKEVLNSLGVTDLLARILASLCDDVTVDGLPDRVVQLLVELLDGGNKYVQQTLYDNLVNVDADGRFLSHIEKRLHHAFDLYNAGKKMSKVSKTTQRVSKTVNESCEHLIQTFRLLQLLCDRHHLGFQNFLRHQSGHTSSQVNIIKTTCEYVIHLCESRESIERFSTVEISLLSQMLLFLIESIQGPCADNQELVVKSDVIIALDSIIYSFNRQDQKMEMEDPTYMDLKSLSCILLSSSLEGRNDDTIHVHLDRKLEKSSLENFKVSLEYAIRDITRRTKHEGRLATRDEKCRIQTKQTALVAVTTILIDLGHDLSSITRGNDDKSFNSIDFLMHNQSGDGSGNGSVNGSMNGSMNSGRKYVAPPSPLIGVVEVAWRGQIERACFPIPFEVKYLPKDTKQNFLDTVDMSSSEKRMSNLIKKSYYFIAEMNLIYSKAESSPLFLRLHTSLPSMKLANYGLIVALNTNILLSPSHLRSPEKVIEHNLIGDHPISKFELMSVMVTIILGSVVVVGYIVIMCTMAVTEIPTAINQVRDEFKIAHRKRRFVEGKTVWDIFGNNIVAGCCSLGFCGLHWINFDFNPLLYFLVLSFVNIPMFMRTMRAYVTSYPKNKRCRNFAIVYDCIFVKSFLRNYFVLCVFCCLGYFVNVEYFSLELLDIVSISPVVADIIRSVTSPSQALMMVFYLFCVTTFIWASFGKGRFHDSLQVSTLNEDGTEGSKNCGHLLQCFYMIFHGALSDQAKLKTFIATAHVGSIDFPMRIIYDAVYVIWVGIILLNVITGLMVDTFSRIREEKNARAVSLANDCFVCGLVRQGYEDMALGHEAPSFDKHIAEEHNPWIYLHYIAYLKAKDPATDSGIESYVRQQMDDQIMEWIPARTSYYLKLQQKE